jgi:predicted Zn-ribbon and HTH transcriptional regulator
MEHVKIVCKIDYYEPYLPPRCRKLRYEHKEEDIKLSVTSVTSQEAPVAFRLFDYHHTSENKTEIRCFRKKLYIRMRMQDIVSGGGEADIMPEKLSRMIRPWFTVSTDRTRELCLKNYRHSAKRYLIVDGAVWELCGEPRYCITTFGLGHNHGGTGLFVDHWYNPNIPNKNYFSALDGKFAVQHADAVAARRGDTNDVGRFEEMIEVLMPECVKIKPMKEHGEGDKTINDLNHIADISSSAGEASVMVLCYAFSHFGKS